MRIAVIGSGYVGLVSGACMADFGHQVTCVDNNVDRVAALCRGEIPIFEPGLAELVAINVRAARLAFTSDLAGAVAAAEVVFIAVGTPTRKDGRADLSAVYAVSREVAAALDGFTVIVTKSTVPVGTGDELEQIVREVNPAADFAMVSNPEFLREGAAIDDFKVPNRVVIGLEDERAREPMAEVYRAIAMTEAPIMFTARRTAELIKYAANAFLAMKITFINEMADLCERAGADVHDVALGIGLDSRIGRKFLQAGPGFGGSCFPKDTLALAAIAQDHGAPLRLVETTVAVNDKRKLDMAQKVIAACGGSVRGKTLAILGLTFKANTDDMREAPSLSIIRALQDEGASVRAFDPAGMEQARPLLPNVGFGTDAYDVARGADALVIVTEWSDFRALDFERLRRTMGSPVLVDLRNLYAERDVTSRGFAYAGIGRALAHAGAVLAEAAE